MEDTVRVLAALLAPTIAIFGIIIAWRQWDINRKRLKMDLFDRRYRIYDAAVRLLQEIQKDGSAHPSGEILQFNVALAESQFLFKKEVESFLEEMHRKARDLQMWERQLGHAHVVEARDQPIRKKTELLTWFLDECPTQLVNVFMPYLKLEH